MGIDEQKEEREVLDSIFPEEITDVSDTEFRLSIALDAPVENGDDEEPESPIIILRVQYPEAYPEVGPDLDISAPPNVVRHRYLDVQEDKAQLLEALLPTIEENLGMAMVFALVGALKDSAEVLMSERAAAVQAVKDVEAAKAELEENKKFEGTAVTRETFLEWRSKFRKEMEDAEKKRSEEKEAEDKKRRVAKEEKKLTGKELWDRGIAGKVDEDAESEDEVDGLEGLKLEN